MIMVTQERRRHWFQFTLSALLALVAVICVLLAVGANRQHRRREAIGQIKRMGGRVGYLSEPSWSNLLKQMNRFARKPGKTAVPKGNPFMRFVGYVPSEYVAVVSFPDSSKISDSDLLRMVVLDETQVVAVGNNPVTDAGLMSLASLPDLMYVSVGDGSKVTYDGIVAFQKVVPNCRVNRVPVR
jgi:hypothetical protein